MPRNVELKLRQEAAIKADVDALVKGKKMRSEAAFEEVGAKYYVSARTVASVCYGEADARRAKAAHRAAAGPAPATGAAPV